MSSAAVNELSTIGPELCEYPTPAGSTKDNHALSNGWVWSVRECESARVREREEEAHVRSINNICAFAFHDHAFKLVPNPSPSRTTTHGPSAINSPTELEQPGPPLSQTTTGALDGFFRASKNLSRISFTLTWRGGWRRQTRRTNAYAQKRPSTRYTASHPDRTALET
jgi:hypothetical protein